MTFTLKIDTDNDAFHPDYALTAELARILHEIADQCAEGVYPYFKTVFDRNGNDVGRFAFKRYDPASI
jgi:hypothetical protein